MSESYSYRVAPAPASGHVCVQWGKSKKVGTDAAVYAAVRAIVEAAAGASFEHWAPAGGLVSGKRARRLEAAVGTLPTGEHASAAAEALASTFHPELGGKRIEVSHIMGSREGDDLGREPSKPREADSLADALERVPGLRLVENFVSEEEEASLMAFADGDGRWDGSLSRRVQHYGAAFDYVTRGARAVPPAAGSASASGAGPGAPASSLPAELAGLVRRVGAAAGAPAGHAEAPNQVTFNEYIPGQGISSHVDTRVVFGAAVCSLSLGADIVMELVACPCKGSTASGRAVIRADAAAMEAGPGAMTPLEADEAAAAALGAAADAEDDTAPARLAAAPPGASAGDTVSLLLPRRSLLVLTGRARHCWRHGIASRLTDRVGGTTRHRARRVSLTVRRVRSAPLPVHDSDEVAPPELHSPALLVAAALRRSVPVPRSRLPPGADAPSPPPSSASARGDTPPAAGAGMPEIERAHVRAFYDAAADHFSATRHSPWPRVASFLSRLAPGSVVADVGCGNGKYALAAPPAVIVVGCDACAGLVRAAAARGANAVVGDAVRCPLASGRFDAALSIAVLHHLSTTQRRAAAVAEIGRTMRPGGRALVQAWAQQQAPTSKRHFSSPDEMVPWRLDGRFAGTAPEEAVRQCARADASATGAAAAAATPAGDVVLDRYCHLFQRGEVPELAARCGLTVLEEWWEAGNWCCVLAKPGGAAPWRAPGGAPPALRAEAAGLGIPVDGPIE